MSTAEAMLLIVLAGLVVLVLGNIAFQVAAERKNPPIGVFTECDGVRLRTGRCRRALRGPVSRERHHDSGSRPKRFDRPPGPSLSRRLLRPARIWLQRPSAAAHLDGHNASFLVREGS